MTVATLFRRPPSVATPDRDLLRRFAADRDDGAFAALVHRHGRLVFATCLRVLSHRADAEDAFQAVWLVLARRAASVRSDAALPGWLHTVAVRTATEVRRMRSRRSARTSRDRERTGLFSEAAPSRHATDPLEQSELASVLDEELAKLPDHYRLAVVLCELNGATRQAAAAQLGIAEGTLSSRLAKARKLLAERLTARGFGAVSGAMLTATLAAQAVARVPVVALDATAGAAVLAVADTVVKALYAAKLKAGVLVALVMAMAGGGGAAWTTALRAGPGDGPGGAPAPAEEKEKDEKPSPAELVAQLGAKDFAEREAAEKALKALGAAAYPAVVDALSKSANPEVVRRCRKLLPDLRAAYLARPDSAVWKRFAAITGDTPLARELFLEMASEPDRGLSLLDHVPATAYANLVEQAVNKLKAGYDEAERAAGGRSGVITPTRGEPTRGDATLLFFLGAAPGSAKPTIPERSFWLFSNCVAHGLSGLGTRAKPDQSPTFPPEVAKLFAAWLERRVGDEYHRKVGLDLARAYAIPAALPAARAVLANDLLSLAVRTPALFVVGAVGEKADLDRVRSFLDCETVFHTTTYHDDNRKQFPLITQVRDVAHAVTGRLLGKHPEEVDFEMCMMYGRPGATAFAQDWYLGFTSDEKRKAAHAKVRALLAKAPVPKESAPKPKKLPMAAALPDELRKEFGGPSVLCTEKMVGELRARAAVLTAKFPSAEDRARIALHTARAVANGRLKEDAATVTAFATQALESSRHPETRWRARSLLASAVSVSDKTADEKRRAQADILVAGYAELIAQDLPDIEPEWPAHPGKRDRNDEAPGDREVHEARQAAYAKARAEVEFVRGLVFGRKVLVMQLRDLCEPNSRDELRALAAKVLTAGEVKTLLARVRDE